MPAVKLTDRYIRSLSCSSEDGRLDYSDLGFPNLKLRVMASGKKIFSFRYQIHGRKRRVKLGEFGDHAHQLSLRDARLKSTQILATVQTGDDPAGQSNSENNEDAAASTVDDLIDLYMARLKRLEHFEVI